MGLPRPSRQIGDRSPTLPLGGGLLIDPEALGQRPQALLTMLYRSTDRLSRRGAPMQNLAHSASFESLDKDAPSKAETKHVVLDRRHRREGRLVRPHRIRRTLPADRDAEVRRLTLVGAVGGVIAPRERGHVHVPPGIYCTAA